MSFLRGLDTKAGRIQEDHSIYDRTPPRDLIYTPIYDAVWVRTRVKELEEQIEELQEKIDSWNSTHEIEEP